MKPCRCRDYPFALAPVCNVERDGNYLGSAVFSRFFQTPYLDTLKPTVVFGGMTARCGSCAQAWYVELEPEQTPTVAFALKLDDLNRPRDVEVRSAQSCLVVLAHNGFSTDRCRQQQCDNFALRGRALCHLHWGFPAYS